ncbi:hypothetical protein cyc_00354 [Cyclospora cayetanensis]|uniref:Uncharacterized protein n=1 Tax=Cyclospora cayetanensis TaxID=88456 RepID=A0A1D3D8H3_9EIME|nr:hypothetical protein cyc_00354 [Cyclospora cayetanensis]
MRCNSPTRSLPRTTRPKQLSTCPACHKVCVCHTPLQLPRIEGSLSSITPPSGVVVSLEHVLSLSEASSCGAVQDNGLERGAEAFLCAGLRERERGPPSHLHGCLVNRALERLKMDVRGEREEGRFGSSSSATKALRRMGERGNPNNRTKKPSLHLKEQQQQLQDCEVHDQQPKDHVAAAADSTRGERIGKTEGVSGRQDAHQQQPSFWRRLSEGSSHGEDENSHELHEAQNEQHKADAATARPDKEAHREESTLRVMLVRREGGKGGGSGCALAQGNKRKRRDESIGEGALTCFLLVKNSEVLRLFRSHAFIRRKEDGKGRHGGSEEALQEGGTEKASAARRREDPPSSAGTAQRPPRLSACNSSSYIGGKVREAE